MEVKQFLGLQVFEFAYLMALAFLPFFVAQREVGLSILSVAFVYLVVSVIRFAISRRVDPANKVVLITGCDSGFGHALARRLSSVGFTVVAGCLDKSSDGAQVLKSDATGRLHVLQLDITDDDSVNSCVNYIKEQFPSKGLWTLVNNAGVLQRGDVEFTPLDTYKKIADVNLFGTIRMTKACLPLIRREKGRVVNVTGATGRISLPSMSAFSVSSYGVEAFSDALRHEMQQFGVKVILVEPGNFYGATGLQNRAALPQIRSEFDKMKEDAPEEALQMYGQDYLDNQYKTVTELSKSAASTLAPVIDALESAVTQGRVGARYLVDGSNQLTDFPNFLIRWESWLPQQIFDNLVVNNYLQKARITSV
ncbi:D-beta-hydroxybutyrate dehydrogenase, mitochondrial-like [Littorina saxatilis]|uniref:Uncharacterized protein n=1 Tax=Littorina saxatilis TaxID=31220 RepID=A0AAN9BYZ6_9CAEN